jgi:hypothetical protein
VAPPRHACLLSVSQAQQAEVAARFSYAATDVVFLGADPEWFLSRLREDGRAPVPARPGPPSCDAVATVTARHGKLCLYDNAELTGAQRAKVLAGHDMAVSAPALFDDGVLRITRLVDGLRLAGELDVSNRHGLAAAMADGPSVIDMRSLRFVDAGGIETMYAAASGRVRLLYPQPVPTRVIRLIDPTSERLVCEGVGSAG